MFVFKDFFSIFFHILVNSVQKYIESVSASSWIKKKLRPDLDCLPVECDRECSYVIKFSSCDECVCPPFGRNPPSHHVVSEAEPVPMKSVTVSQAIPSLPLQTLFPTHGMTTQSMFFNNRHAALTTLKVILPHESAVVNLKEIFAGSMPELTMFQETAPFHSLTENKPGFLGITFEPEPQSQFPDDGRLVTLPNPYIQAAPMNHDLQTLAKTSVFETVTAKPVTQIVNPSPLSAASSNPQFQLIPTNPKPSQLAAVPINPDFQSMPNNPDINIQDALQTMLASLPFPGLHVETQTAEPTTTEKTARSPNLWTRAEGEQLFHTQSTTPLQCPIIFCPKQDCITITNSKGCQECACDFKFWKTTKPFSSPENCLNGPNGKSTSCNQNCIMITKLDGCVECACPLPIFESAKPPSISPPPRRLVADHQQSGNIKA